MATQNPNNFDFFKNIEPLQDLIGKNNANNFDFFKNIEPSLSVKPDVPIQNPRRRVFIVN